MCLHVLDSLSEHIISILCAPSMQSTGLLSISPNPLLYYSCFTPSPPARMTTTAKPRSAMASAASPYLSPPAELQLYAEEPLARTINPQILTSLDAPPGPLQFSSSLRESATTLVPDYQTKVKSEAEEDYGFSKFAAERDAARDEMDMDEDTRLLLSEEGKKLSSKERRQLRNKVSARNFRERRKEYITHLESLVSKHQNEACQYKKQADALRSEKDELASELSRLKITISAAFESNKMQSGSSFSSATLGLARPLSRSGTPTRETSLIPSMTKDINPYSANANFNVDWPLSGMPSPSGSFDFNLHNYTSVFSASPLLPTLTFSEKELLGKGTAVSSDVTGDVEVGEGLAVAFDNILSSLLGVNWTPVGETS